MAAVTASEPQLDPSARVYAGTANLETPVALARFEFEAGKSNDGTKVLMIEWEEDEVTRNTKGDWHLSWTNLDRTLLVGDPAADGIRRIYYLLPENAFIPPTITLTFEPIDDPTARRQCSTTPLPAIFPPELGATARTAGKKGVLHTMWAKKRLAALNREIEDESTENAEGIGLQIAIQEKEWIESNFGVASRPTTLKLPESPGGTTSTAISPQSPRSPGGGRFLEKMKGLKLNTLDRGSSDDGRTAETSNPLSPEETDVAVSSFAAFKGPTPSTDPQASHVRRVVAQGPPSAVLAAQEQQTMDSLDSITAFAPREKGAPATETDDGLFALPMSPRSPETKTSPFSFKVEDTQRYREFVGKE